jgi:glycerol-3-phosphate dehydrogenase
MSNPPSTAVSAPISHEDEFTAVGTTDVAFVGDAGGATISPQETDYVCETINHYFSARKIAPADVVWSYAGVRPLFDDASADISKVTRDYRLELKAGAEEAPQLSVYGGKITTYRKLAEGVMARLQPLLSGASSSWTARSPLPGGTLRPACDLRRNDSSSRGG